MVIEKNTIPKGWKKKKIKDLLIYERPDSYIVKSTSYSQNGKTPVLTANKSFVLGHTDEDFGICNNVPAIIFDDFTTDAKYVDFPFKVKSSAIKILRCVNEGVSLKYIYELMKLIKFPVGNHKRYYISQYQNLEIAIPPKEEQKKIVEILACVDEDIEKTDEMIKKTQKLKKGLIEELFPIISPEKGIGYRGNLDMRWNLVKLFDISINLDNKRIPITKSKRVKGEFPYYGATGIVDYVNDYIFDEDLLLISEDGANLQDRNYPIAFVARGKYWVNNHAHIQKFKDKNLQTIVLYYLNNINLKLYLTGMAQPKLNKDRLNSIPIPIPVSEECQKQIAEILSAVDDKINIYKQIKLKLTELKKGLMQDLLRGEVRVIM